MGDPKLSDEDAIATYKQKLKERVSGLTIAPDIWTKEGLRGFCRASHMAQNSRDEVLSSKFLCCSSLSTHIGK